MSTIIENNKLIAEFMGLKQYDNKMWDNPTRHSLCFDLNYHSAWNWLMPVWKKCTEIGLWMMTNGHEKLWLEKSKEIENTIIREFDCQKASSKIAQLIQWYNEQIKNS